MLKLQVGDLASAEQLQLPLCTVCNSGRPIGGPHATQCVICRQSRRRGNKNARGSIGNRGNQNARGTIGNRGNTQKGATKVEAGKKGKAIQLKERDLMKKWNTSNSKPEKSSPNYSNSKWLHIVIPGNLWADIYSCEWILYIGPLRCACRECWNMPVQEWFAQWMNKHNASCFKEAEHTDLESLFWFFRWSYTQRCFLRLIYLASAWKCSPEGKSTRLLH